MKTISKLVLIVMLILMAGCSQIKRASQDNRVTVTGSGNLISQEVVLSGFDRVEAGLTFDIKIHQGENFLIVLTSDDNFIEYIHVEQSGRTISFGFKPGYAYDYSGVTLRADVTMPELAGLHLSGNGHATLDSFKTVEGFEAELSGSSLLEGELNAAKASFSLSGSTYTKMVGSAENLRLDVCGNSVADLGSYRVEDAALEVSCNSTSVVNVTEKLEVDASQYAQVYYNGSPASVLRQVYQGAYVGPKE